MKRLHAAFLLATSSATLVCCALPAALVLLGLGTTVVAMVNRFPGLVWLSERKDGVFAAAGLLLALGGWAQWRARRLACPPDAAQAEACRTTRDWSVPVYWTSVGLYLTGVLFAYVLGRL